MSDLDNATNTPQQSDIQTFSFGEPESVLGNNIADYLGIFAHDEHSYYETPVSQAGLIKLTRANAHHGTIPFFKRNLFRKFFVPSKALSAEHAGNACYDFMVLGQCYLQRVQNRYGHTLGFTHLPGINMRRMKADNQYCRLRAGKDPIIFKPGEVVHLKEYDPNQEIYGTPQYMGGIQSVLLNEDATLFRRRYYRNGAHMGYIFYTADAKLSPEDEALLKEKVKSSKGVGNFRSMFLNIPGGRPDSVKIIPVGDIATKDEFQRIKDISRNDILSMWRMPAALAGIMPENTGGFGDIQKISQVHFENEVAPLQDVFKQLNEYLPRSKWLTFTEPKISE